ncbi:MAG: penicillin-binding protein [bacterium]|nr:penicillin-binding protein [bacterium]
MENNTQKLSSSRKPMIEKKSSPTSSQFKKKSTLPTNKDKSISNNTTAKSNLKPLSKAERRLAKKRGPRWKRWLLRLFIVGVVGFALLVLAGIGAFAWFAKDLPSPDQLENRVLAESTKIYDRSGEHLLYETGKDVRRTYTKIEDISPYMADATVALEDKKFYEHKGFDPVGILRSAGINVATDQQVGGSTITQQFVKMAIVGNEKTYSRKIKELILSVELERKYDKDQILEFYLNEASYGGVNMGVAAASQSYFGKTPSELSLAESALLSSIPQRPTYYISQDREALYERKDFALDRMVEEGYITEEEADAAKTEDVTIQQTIAIKDAPHFVDYVLSQLEDDFGGAFINQGLRVTTTLDFDKQEIAESVIQDGMGKVEQYGGSNASLISIDAHTGQVLVMVGSKDYYSEDYDGQVNVATSLRQPGSSFKPLVYMTAFDSGYNPNTILFDVRTNFTSDSGDYIPSNYSGGFSGPVTIRRALGQSLNIPAVKALYLVGVDRVIDVAESFGYTSFQDRSRYGLALVLGGGEVTLLEHTSAFATFAREGVRHPVTTILKVEDQKGAVLYEWSNTENQVIDQVAVQNLNSILSDPSARAGFTALNISGRTLAAKTGTTNNYRDAWAMGYTPSFATGVWVGNNDNTEMHNGAAGLVVAAPMMNDYMSRILDGLPDEGFNSPPPAQANKAVLWGGIGTSVEKIVDKNTQHIIPDECISSYPEEFKQTREFKEVHNILYYLTKEDPLGDAPSEPQNDPMFNNWEAGVKAWSNGQEEYISDEMTYEDCNLRSSDQIPSVSITYPAVGARLTSATFDIQTSIDPGTGRNIKETTYIIDSNVIDVKTSPPFNTGYNPTNLTNGKHTLTVRVTNDRDNTNEHTIIFTYMAQGEIVDTSNSNTNNQNSSNTNENSNSNSNKNSSKNKNN